MVVVEKEEEKGKASKKTQENSLPAQIEELKFTHAKEMSAMRADLNEIKTALLSNSKPRVHWGNFDAKKR